MKRITLIFLIIASVTWMGYFSYDLWFNNNHTIEPKDVFCKEDGSVLLINRFAEIQETDFLQTISSNPLTSVLKTLDSLNINQLKVYISDKRPIILFEKNLKWNKKEVRKIKNRFKQTDIQFRTEGNFFMVSKDFQSCKTDSSSTFLSSRDKKASANYWKYDTDQWKRTDIYNLNKGYFEYRSSEPHATYGKAVKDIPLFASAIPSSSSTYLFQERFYAAAKDSIFRKGPMNEWVGKGFVEIDYDNHPVLISDYRSQQLPSLILIEKSKNEDSVVVGDEIHSFAGFQLTKDFPTQKNGRFYTVEIEDKVIFSESKKIARKIVVDYQLGKTMALTKDKKDDFFGGLPSRVNKRSVSVKQKRSLTWKKGLLFEVNTLPPNHQLASVDKSIWSTSIESDPEAIVPIPDHLRKGTSLFKYNSSGDYILYGPNGNTIWKGSVDEPILGDVHVIDVFENNKHQFLFRTAKKVHLIDLNGNTVGGFPYQSDEELTSGISDFVWNGTRQFIVGTKKGELILMNSAGQELNIIQVSKNKLISTPYALNIKGNLRAWAIDSDKEQFLAYLETPAKPDRKGKTSAAISIKSKGQVSSYFTKEGTVYVQHPNETDVHLVDKGEIFKVTPQHLIISKENTYKVYNHEQEINFSLRLPFNEVSSFDLVMIKKKKYAIVMDYLQNKIHAYNTLGEELEGFPKEGRNHSTAYYNESDETLYIYTQISNSIICYKKKF